MSHAQAHRDSPCVWDPARPRVVPFRRRPIEKALDRAAFRPRAGGASDETEASAL